MYEYRAQITAVYDGDTVTASVDLGFRVTLHDIKLRLYGIDAPEVRLGRGTTQAEKARGIEARDWLRQKVLGKWVVVRTFKDKTGKYGRWLATIYLPGDDGTSINQAMVNAGLAKPLGY